MVKPKSLLFMGGAGTISEACVKRAVELGHHVTVVNRGKTSLRALPDAVEVLTADATDHEALAAVLGDRKFDAVAQFRAFTPDHVARDIELFRNRTKQYVFISSASAYQKPLQKLPITESTPLVNPFWQYSRDKIACEDLLWQAIRDTGFPATIVRPSHTYDDVLIPTVGGWTDVARLRAGKPVIIPGDGTTHWTLTNSRDFAVAFVALLGNPLAIGDVFNIVGDYAPTWNQIYDYLAAAAGVENPQFIHVASETIARAIPEHGPGLLGDKAYDVLFDNSKIKALVPEFRTTITYDDAVHDQIKWYESHPDRQLLDEAWDAASDRLAAHALSI